MLSSNTSAVSGDATYIEDVFSTYLYTGTGAAQTITNNIDLSTKGGLVWTKRRSLSAGNGLIDTVRGATKSISTNTQGAQATVADSLTAFTTTGYTLGADASVNSWNTSGTYASWTFRKQPKFFDIVTYTGNGSARTIAHNLGSVPGCIIIKRLDAAFTDWIVYHRSTGAGSYTLLNTTDAAATSTTYFNNTSPTSTVFSLGGSSTTNANTGSYVAYLFAHDAGGFGLTGTDNVISCGSFTTDGSGNATVNLGYEPQWVMVKASNAAYQNEMYDNMRGMSVPGTANLYPSQSIAESYGATYTGCVPTATGFTSSAYWGAGVTLIYIAIRRGPMKVPTDATKVFQPVTYTGTVLNTNIGTMGPIDAFIVGSRDGYGTSYSQFVFDRLRGAAPELATSKTAAEVAFSSTVLKFDTQAGWNTNTSTTSYINGSGYNYVSWNFKRAPSFFDEVCSTGTGAAKSISHNLGVAPELIINKNRTGTANDWCVWCGAAVSGNSNTLFLNNTQARYAGPNYWGASYAYDMNATTFSVGSSTATNEAGSKYVSYLFATCPGVSKVGSYTGTGTTKQVDCGFTAGARFVLIKRTDSTGDWYVWDTARGIVSGNDPYLLLNSTAAEVTSTDYIDTYSAGFELSSTAPAALNASGGTYIFLAIA